MRVSMYHVSLRIASLLTAFALVFDSGLLFPVTQQLSDSAQQYLANSIGASAFVTPTELNTLTAELTAQKQALDAREEALATREISVGLNTSQRQESNLSTYLLSVVLFIIVVLMVLNYALDFARERRLMYLQQHAKIT
mgnify:CR=1 FL=1